MRRKKFPIMTQESLTKPKLNIYFFILSSVWTLNSKELEPQLTENLGTEPKFPSHINNLWKQEDKIKQNF